ncbi:hypothetical protein BC938DRAFT_482932 [Jimgerdemannia flammicorona]|uniref:Uncharacterized protein n=1 Tax=Jimgerdemannia flammicorona TaxID=994334 RepID=A0A433QCY2_9FUNG|nr:hypothetical protein BC938DRAFT_482932 [Jimgerdemannia flammicorona]
MPTWRLRIYYAQFRVTANGEFDIHIADSFVPEDGGVNSAASPSAVASPTSTSKLSLMSASRSHPPSSSSSAPPSSAAAVLGTSEIPGIPKSSSPQSPPASSMVSTASVAKLKGAGVMGLA